MKKQILQYLLLLAIFHPAAALHARMPDPAFTGSIEMKHADAPLVKLGEYRYVYRMFFKLYDVALYSASKGKQSDILQANTGFRLQFRYLREIDKSIILESSATILERNLSSQDLESIQERVDLLNEAYRTVRKGDYSSLTYLPNIGTTLRINDEVIITIEGQDFAQLYFQIWLGERPISEPLREELLG